MRLCNPGCFDHDTFNGLSSDLGVLNMIILAGLGSAILLVVAAIHLLWAIGYWWPIRDEAALARAVVGTKGITKMPGAAPTAIVVVLLMFAAAWPWFPPSPIKSAGLVIIALVFQARCVAAYAPFWKRMSPEQPFRRLDETRYAPLIGGLGLIYMMQAARAAGGG